MDADKPNDSPDLLKVPEDPAAILFVPTEDDAERVAALLEEQVRAEDFGTGDGDVTLWSELQAQLNKQRD